MANVAVIDSTTAHIFPSGKVWPSTMPKRKTPSQLRGEQLKRRNHGTSGDSQIPNVVNGNKKSEPLKIPKYIDTHVDEVYPVKKFSDGWRILQGREKFKDPILNTEKTDATSELANEVKSQTPSDESRSSDVPETAVPIVEDIKDVNSHKLEKCSQNTFRTVKELSLGDKGLRGPSNIDMEKALKRLVAHEIFYKSVVSTDSAGKHGVLPAFSGKILPEFNLLGHKSPLDFTLKTALRMVSSASVKWCHKLLCGSVYSDAFQFSNASEVLYSKALHTWTHPQSSLPSSVISAMASSSSKAESNFLLKRQQDWEDAFRSLYYMLRKNISNIFYVHTTQFVAMFVRGNLLGKKKHSCNAYLSQSTHGLRSLLREHDIHFSMPLCHSEPEQASDDDLVELSEIERQNLGQTVHVDSLSDIDSSPKSLLAFIGNNNTHALYDFLLNYRHFLSSLVGIDVPVLHSPVPFQNAAVSIPEVKCKEMRRADMLAVSSGTDTEDGKPICSSTASTTCYSIEIKDPVIPPWVISRLCAAMGSEGRTFESDFTTEPLSTGLNVALDSICCNTASTPEAENCSPINGDSIGIPEAVITPQLSSAFLRGLKYTNGSYEARLTLL